MKKLIALMLAIVMVVAMMSASVVAFAEGEAVIVGGSITTVCESEEEVTVDVAYTGETEISSVRISIDSEIPVKDVTSEYNYVYNKDNGKIVIWADEGKSFGASTLCTISYVISDWYKNGSYPIHINFIDASAADTSTITLAASDGEIIIDNRYLLGDVDFDGDVDNADIILVARYIVELVEFTPKLVFIGDMDQDGEVSNTDLITIAKIVVGLEELRYIGSIEAAAPAEPAPAEPTPEA